MNLSLYLNRKALTTTLENAQEDVFMMHFGIISQSQSFVLRKASLRCLYNWVHYRVINLDKLFTFDIRIQDGIFKSVCDIITHPELSSDAYEFLMALIPSSNSKKGSNFSFVSASSLQSQTSHTHHDSVLYYLRNVLVLRNVFHTNKDAEEDSFEFRLCSHIANVLSSLGESNVSIFSSESQHSQSYLQFLLEITECSHKEVSEITLPFWTLFERFIGTNPFYRDLYYNLTTILLKQCIFNGDREGIELYRNSCEPSLLACFTLIENMFIEYLSNMIAQSGQENYLIIEVVFFAAKSISSRLTPNHDFISHLMKVASQILETSKDVNSKEYLLCTIMRFFGQIAYLFPSSLLGKEYCNFCVKFCSSMISKGSSDLQFNACQALCDLSLYASSVMLEQSPKIALLLLSHYDILQHEERQFLMQGICSLIAQNQYQGNEVISALIDIMSTDLINHHRNETSKPILIHTLSLMELLFSHFKSVDEGMAYLQYFVTEKFWNAVNCVRKIWISSTYFDEDILESLFDVYSTIIVIPEVQTNYLKVLVECALEVLELRIHSIPLKYIGTCIEVFGSDSRYHNDFVSLFMNMAEKILAQLKNDSDKDMLESSLHLFQSTVKSQLFIGKDEKVTEDVYRTFIQVICYSLQEQVSATTQSLSLKLLESLMLEPNIGMLFNEQGRYLVLAILKTIHSSTNPKVNILLGKVFYTFIRKYKQIVEPHLWDIFMDNSFLDGILDKPMKERIVLIFLNLEAPRLFSQLVKDYSRVVNLTETSDIFMAYEDTLANSTR